MSKNISNFFFSVGLLKVYGYQLLLCSSATYDFFSDLDKEIYFTNMEDSLLHGEEAKNTGYEILSLKAECHGGYAIELVDQVLLNDYWRNDLNEILIDYNANALLIMSSPAISNDGKNASLLTYLFCGSLCGSVEEISLTKVGSTWKITESKTISVS